MSFLLTGGTGYVGSHTAAALLHAGLEVVLLDNLSNSTAKVAAGPVQFLHQQETVTRPRGFADEERALASLVRVLLVELGA